MKKKELESMLKSKDETIENYRRVNYSLQKDLFKALEDNVSDSKIGYLLMLFTAIAYTIAGILIGVLLR